MFNEEVLRRIGWLGGLFSICGGRTWNCPEGRQIIDVTEPVAPHARHASATVLGGSGIGFWRANVPRGRRPASFVGVCQQEQA